MNRTRLTLWIGILWLLLFVAATSKQINLANSDLPRHLANGRWLRSFPELLHKNFWSSLSPEYPFINHHWGFGVIAYSVFTLFGWVALSWMQISLLLGCAVISYGLSFSQASIENRNRARSISVAVGLLVLPLLVARVEVRPEAFSYFFLLLTWKWIEKPSSKAVFLMPLLSVLWVNLHSVFFLGLVLQAIFVCFEENHLTRMKRVRVFGLSLLATLANPNGLAGAMIPLTLMKNWSYDLIELQPIWKLLPLPVFEPLIWPIGLLLLILICTIAIGRRFVFSSAYRTEFVILLFAVALGAAQSRNLPMASFLIWPILVRWILRISNESQKKLDHQVWLLLTAAMPGLFFTLSPTLADRLGWGLMPGQEKTIEFIQSLPEGRVFNTFEVSGLLIWAGFPRLRPWIDNRPEAYSRESFDQYRALQREPEEWKKWQRSPLAFDWIILNWHDPTSWALTFRKSIAKDPDLAPVFIDSQVVIYVRRQERLRDWITAHEIHESASN